MRSLRTFALGGTLILVALLGASLLFGIRRPPERPVSVEPALSQRIRVEVLNAAGLSDLARGATAVLREDPAFDVVFWGNASRFGRDSSIVLDRVGRPEMARRVADALGIRHVRSEPDTTLYLEATVLLGEDWASRQPTLPGLKPVATGGR